jgi:signal transduction histidine kinase
VGDGPAGEETAALVAAAREAMNNAVRHSGAAQVDVYVEVAGDHAEVFVRDRGRGFDLDAVPLDRLGVRGSIVARMQRHGGTAEVRSTPDQGTEVRLGMRLPGGGDE